MQIINLESIGNSQYELTYTHSDPFIEETVTVALIDGKWYQCLGIELQGEISEFLAGEDNA